MIFKIVFFLFPLLKTWRAPSSGIYWRNLVKLLRKISLCCRSTLLPGSIFNYQNCLYWALDFPALSLWHSLLVNSVLSSWNSHFCIYLLFQILGAAFFTSLTAQEGLLLSVRSYFHGTRNRKYKNKLKQLQKKGRDGGGAEIVGDLSATFNCQRTFLKFYSKLFKD